MLQVNKFQGEWTISDGYDDGHRTAVKAARDGEMVIGNTESALELVTDLVEMIRVRFEAAAEDQEAIKKIWQDLVMLGDVRDSS